MQNVFQLLQQKISVNYADIINYLMHPKQVSTPLKSNWKFFFYPVKFQGREFPLNLTW